MRTAYGTIVEIFEWVRRKQSPALTRLSPFLIFSRLSISFGITAPSAHSFREGFERLAVLLHEITAGLQLLLNRRIVRRQKVSLGRLKCGQFKNLASQSRLFSTSSKKHAPKPHTPYARV